MAQKEQYQLLSRAKSDFFNVDELHYYKLALHLGIHNFRVCVTDTRYNRCLLLEDYKFKNTYNESETIEQLRCLYDEHHLLQAGFWESVTLSVTNQKFTLVPDALFKEDYYTDYLALNAEIEKEKERVLFFKHNNPEAVNIFTINKAFAEWFDNAYPTKTIDIVHQTSALIEGALHHKYSANKTVLFICLESNLLSIVAKKQKNILFCNTFEIMASTDFLYFVLYVFNELKLNPEENTVYIYGDIKHNSDFVTLLYKYVRNVNFGAKPSLLSYTYQFDDILDHNYFEVYNMHLC